MLTVSLLFQIHSNLAYFIKHKGIEFWILESKLNTNFNIIFPTDLEPNGIPFGAKINQKSVILL